MWKFGMLVKSVISSSFVMQSVVNLPSKSDELKRTYVNELYERNKYCSFALKTYQRITPS